MKICTCGVNTFTKFAGSRKLTEAPKPTVPEQIQVPPQVEQRPPQK